MFEDETGIFFMVLLYPITLDKSNAYLCKHIKLIAKTKFFVHASLAEQFTMTINPDITYFNRLSSIESNLFFPLNVTKIVLGCQLLHFAVIHVFTSSSCYSRSNHSSARSKSMMPTFRATNTQVIMKMTARSSIVFSFWVLLLLLISPSASGYRSEKAKTTQNHCPKELPAAPSHQQDDAPCETHGEDQRCPKESNAWKQAWRRAGSFGGS